MLVRLMSTGRIVESCHIALGSRFSSLAPTGYTCAALLVCCSSSKPPASFTFQPRQLCGGALPFLYCLFVLLHWPRHTSTPSHVRFPPHFLH